MQLVAFYGNNFFLSHAAMLVNEGLPNFIVEELRKRRDLSKSTVGILGTAFKADIDDVRNSLSFKLAKILKFHGAKVVCSDEYARNPAFVSKKKITRSSDIVVIGVPHSAYKGMSFPRRVEVIDLWGVTKRGTRR
jgi:UDP-N-acetyl-D-mannosaminuronic acid dehydrogenase